MKKLFNYIQNYLMARNRLIQVAVITAILIPCTLFPINNPVIRQWHKLSQEDDAGKIIKWMKCHADARLSTDRRAAGKICSKKLNVNTPPFYGRLGIFVTLKKGRDVRGCFGAFSHQSLSLESVLLEYLKGAMTQDPRYEPLDISEMEDTSIIITISSQPFPVADPEYIDTGRYGIIISCDGREKKVFVPAEIRSRSYLERYLRGNNCQVSAFRAVTLQGSRER